MSAGARARPDSQRVNDDVFILSKQRIDKYMNVTLSFLPSLAYIQRICPLVNDPAKKKGEKNDDALVVIPFKRSIMEIVSYKLPGP